MDNNTNSSYLTIKAPSEGLFKDKGSKFISYAFPVTTEDEIKEKVDILKKKYYDARHHCYAYVLGAERAMFRSNDDREPSGTAGKPILGQLNSQNLTNILVVVVRYFGGTLLGTSGLINAYKEATISALQNSQVIKKIVTELYYINFQYEATNEVMKIVKDYNLFVTDQHFGSECSLFAKIGVAEKEIILTKLNKIESVSLKYDRTE